MGSDGGARRAQHAAEQAERERQARIASTISSIDQVFSSPERQGQYDQFLTALRDFYGADATRQRDVADRERRFAMARSGLTGGSADTDSRLTLGDEFQRAILGAEDQAQAALGDLRAQDEATRTQLTQLAQAGLDATTATRRAGEAMQQSAAAMQSNARSRGLGDMFGTTLGAVERSRNAAAMRRGQQQPVGSVYGTGFGN